MDKVCCMDEEILKMKIEENSKLLDQLLKELKDSAIQLTSSEKATA
jgi:hypothetical protein